MLLSVCGAAGGGGAPQPAGAVVVDLNAQVLFGEAVPFYMKRNLGEFPRRIVDTAAGTVIGESEGFDADQQHEAVIGLQSLALEKKRRANRARRSRYTSVVFLRALLSWNLSPAAMLRRGSPIIRRPYALRAHEMLLRLFENAGAR